MPNEFDLDSAIRKVKDFPKKGILFYDITSVLTTPRAFAYCCKKMEGIYADVTLDAVAAIEARGFVFAAPFAVERGIPLILIRKKGKLPGKTLSEEYSLEYGTDTVEVHKEDLKAGMRILLIDDLIATGGTLRAAARLLEKGGGSVSGIFSVIGLTFLSYAKILSDYRVTTLINYDHE